ncbi:MAG: DUF697 domain-containing protein [Myxococcota bacterium]
MEPTRQQADTLIRNHVIGSSVIGLFPFPLIDIALLSGAQLYMLRRLSELYEVDFSSELGRSFVATLIASVTPMTTASSIVKWVPLVGWLTAGLFSGASTYAVGKVFVQHFESGGTFLTFDPEKVREYYRQQFSQGTEVVRDLRRVKP